MDPDDRAHLFQVMPADLISRLMTQLSPRERRSTELLLAYPNETAGRIMNPEFVRLKPGMTVSEGLAEVRRNRDKAETIYVLPVSDDEMRLVGTIGLEDLVLAEPNQRIEIADKDSRNIPFPPGRIRKPLRASFKRQT